MAFFAFHICGCFLSNITTQRVKDYRLRAVASDNSAVDRFQKGKKSEPIFFNFLMNSKIQPALVLGVATSDAIC